MSKSKKDLFLELAKPNKKGKSRWVSIDEFKGKYKSLVFGNGADWARASSSLSKKYIIEFDKNITPGNRIDRIRTIGFTKNSFSQQINKRIIKEIKKQRCVVLGTSNPEVDHKNGRKNDNRLNIVDKQKLDDFQPLSKAANDAKRQFCKDCKNTGIRYDAKQLGYPMSFYNGGKKHNNKTTGCIGCYWYDPIEFKKHLMKK